MNTHYDRETLIDYLHGALAPEADAGLFIHLQACTECNAVYDEEAALGDALRFAACTEELEFPSMIKAKVWDTIRRDKPSWIDVLRAGWLPRVAAPVAAVVLLAGYLGLPSIIHSGQVTPGVDAAYFLDVHNAEVQQNPFGPGVGPATYTSDTQDRGTSSAASYIDAADAATLDDADAAIR
jgi:anti-sigma factor RsiW